MSKLYCNECEKEVIPVDGKCPKCGLEFNPDVSDLRPFNEPKYESSSEEVSIEYGSKNTISSVLKVIAWIILIVGFIVGIVLGRDQFDDFSFGLALSYWITYGIAFLGIYSVAEIIQILHDIREKVCGGK